MGVVGILRFRHRKNCVTVFDNVYNINSLKIHTAQITAMVKMSDDHAELYLFNNLQHSNIIGQLLNSLQSDFINMEIHMLNNLQVTLSFIIKTLQSKFEINSQNQNQ